jgi:hypothetical protein
MTHCTIPAVLQSLITGDTLAVPLQYNIDSDTAFEKTVSGASGWQLVELRVPARTAMAPSGNWCARIFAGGN